MSNIDRKRKIRVFFRVSEKEQDLISRKMQQANIINREAYLRKQAIDGYVIRMDLSDVREMVRLLRITSNNINQIAKRANETHSIYAFDIAEIQKQYDRLWNKTNDILTGLASVRQ